MTDTQTSGQSPRHNSKRKILFIGILLFVLGTGAIAGWLLQYSLTVGPDGPPEMVVLVPQGASVAAIGKILAEAGVIHEDIRFSYLAGMSGMAGKLRAGEFALRTGKLPLAVLRDLVKALPVQHSVTIVEGLRAEQVAAIFARDGWCDAVQFMERVHDSRLIASLGFDKLTSLEGYLYPDTYSLTRIPEIAAEDIIRMMVNRFLTVWKDIKGEDEQMHQVVILASIVEKETGAAFERARIASVFHNRLARGMRLQSDPTVIYGIKDFSGNLTRDHLQTSTPYNTYAMAGLPVGAICNPGKESLLAVLQPSNEEFLYFVSKNDGTHHFSKNLNEHNNAVYKYQILKTKQ